MTIIKTSQMYSGAVIDYYVHICVCVYVNMIWERARKERGNKRGIICK